jgi:hypothetical protein
MTGEAISRNLPHHSVSGGKERERERGGGERGRGGKERMREREEERTREIEREVERKRGRVRKLAKRTTKTLQKMASFFLLYMAFTLTLSNFSPFPVALFLYLLPCLLLTPRCPGGFTKLKQLLKKRADARLTLLLMK